MRDKDMYALGAVHMCFFHAAVYQQSSLIWLAGGMSWVAASTGLEPPPPVFQ